jgi:very-short-patch-repair endonuclease
MTEPGQESLVRERASALFGFLRSVCLVKSQTIYDLSSYERVFWLSDIPEKVGCYSIARHIGEEVQDGDTWIHLKKPKLKSYPKPDSELALWLNPVQLSNSSIEVPDLKVQITVAIPKEPEKKDRQNDEDSEQSEIEIRTLEDYPHIKSLYQTYIEEEWWPWKEYDEQIRPAQHAYEALFFLYQRQQSTGERFEIVLGLGLVQWKTRKSKKTQEGAEVDEESKSKQGQNFRHIVSCKVAVKFDSRNGSLTVGPETDGSGLQFEEEFVPPERRPELEVMENLNRQLDDAGYDIWQGPAVRSAIEQWTNEVSGSSTYSSSIEKPKRDIREEPRVSFSPALILRTRTNRALISMFDQILAELKGSSAIPPAVTRFLTVGNEGIGEQVDQRADGDERTSDQLASGSSGEIYFPLESNLEQRKIVESLDNSDGVLVQGPPGTGKSHTIVNLICHLIATGQRVLVTSQKPRALQVLRDFIKDKVPTVSPLAVIQLGADGASMEAMEQSVLGITGRQNQWDRDSSIQQIQELETSLDKARRERAKILHRLSELREGETYAYENVFGCYTGTRSDIAKETKSEVERFSWLVDEPAQHDSDDTREVKIPCGVSEASELLGLLRNSELGKIDPLTEDPIDVESLPTVPALSVLFSKETEQLKIVEHHGSGLTHPIYPKLSGLNNEDLVTLSGKLEKLKSGFEDIATHILPWTNECVIEILADKDRHWKTLLKLTKQEIDHADGLLSKIGNTRVSGLDNDKENLTVFADTEKLIEYLESGKKIRGLFRSRMVKDTEYIHQHVRCDGQNPDNIETLKKFKGWIGVQIHLSELEVRWKSLGTAQSQSPDLQLDEYRDFCEPLEQSLELLELKRAIQSDCKANDLPEPNWHENQSIVGLCVACAAAIAAHNLEDIRNAIGEISRNLDDRTVRGAGSHKNRLRKSVLDRSIDSWVEVWEDIEAENKKRVQQLRRSELFLMLEASMPLLAKSLYESSADDNWDYRLTELQRASNHKCAIRWLVKTSEPGSEILLRQKLDDSDVSEREALGELASLKAWQCCFERMTDEERQNLIAWSKATRRIGKGQGKYTQRHRETAKKHMEGCRNAVPAWVLPIYRVAEFMQPGKDLFDVVIVDEASQSGLDALFLTYIARKVVVVGDDKQISPVPFANQEEVDQLRRQYIKDIPHSEEYNVTASLFDMTDIRYKGRIRLREHFRCMPEIIQFSNSLCYAGEPLIPLRQYGVDRLEPVVEVVFISDGYIKESSTKSTSNRVNPPEAEAIAQKIASLCDDPKYEGKTFGVISLQGSSQAQVIERELMEILDSKHIEERRITCGDAYSFQGDERDVMFLSMVAALDPNKRIGPLTREADQQRFNVAASRAKDQLFLFHSVNLIDLNPNCMRHKLLTYCKSPTVEQTEIKGMSISEIRVRAKDFDRQIEKPPKPFDSWFEVDVFLDIANRGYRVIPQYSVAGKRIDLLVEGMKGRLAVECDGDAWHGMDEYEDDLERQRKLERVGLSFFRIRGSSYYFDKEGSLQKLWKTLDEHGIFPGGMEGRDIPVKESIVEKIMNVSTPTASTIEKGSVDDKQSAAQMPAPPAIEFLTESQVKQQQPDQVDEVEEGLVKSKSRGLRYIACNPREAIDDTDLIDPNKFFEWSYNKVLLLMVEYVVNKEGPIFEDLLAIRIARAHSFQKTGSRIKERISKLIRKRYSTTIDPLTGSISYWPETIRPNEWNRFRLPEGEDDIRPVDKIPLVELAVVVRRVISEDVDDPPKRIADLMEIKRLRQSARTHLQKAFDVVSSGGDLF